jgi:protein translocase SecG subunit
MMILIGFLTVVLVIDCLFLTLLVLVQLPKKEAGMGQAFGGAATDALFGAGSGNALTKMTKYATGIFFILTLMISILFSQNAKSRNSGLERELQKANATPEAAPGGAATSANANKGDKNIGGDKNVAGAVDKNAAGNNAIAATNNTGLTSTGAGPSLLLSKPPATAPATTATNK